MTPTTTTTTAITRAPAGRCHYRPFVPMPAWARQCQCQCQCGSTVCPAQDAILRFGWALTISPSFFNLDSISDMWFSTITSTLEIWRRFVWVQTQGPATHSFASANVFKCLESPKNVFGYPRNHSKCRARVSVCREPTHLPASGGVLGS